MYLACLLAHDVQCAVVVYRAKMDLPVQEQTPVVTYQGFTNRQLAHEYPRAIAPDQRTTVMITLRLAVACRAVV